jgi:hypothetical protein
MGEVYAPIIKNRKTNAPKFSSLPHEAKVHLCGGLAKTNFGISTVSAHKREITSDQLKKTGDRSLNFYTTRFLLERISWLVRDARKTGEGDGRCKLVFSENESLSYAALMSYIAGLKQRDDTRIEWSALDLERVDLATHGVSLGCRLADAAASGLGLALEPNPYGRVTDDYARAMVPRLYERGGNYRKYGLKFFPKPPDALPDGTHKWIWDLKG